MVDLPVTPAVSGTFDAGPRTKYTVGREHVQAVLVEMMRKDRRFACDIETFGLGVHALRVKCIAFSHADHCAILDPRDPAQAHLARKTFQHATELAFHNSIFDVPVLVRNDLMTAAQIEKVVDTLIFARLADPDEKSRKSLDACARSLLGMSGENMLVQTFRAQGFTKSQGFYAFDIDRIEYLAGAVTDGLVTAAIRPLVEQAARRQITEDHPFTVWGVTGDEAERLLWREQRINRLMLRRTCKGMRVDFEFLDRYRERTSVEVAEQAAVLEAAGIRPGVGNDLAAVLDGMGAMPEDHPRTPKTGNYRMTARDVETIGHPLARTFVAHKRTVKVRDDYLGKVVDLASAGRIHPTTSILAAWTGRSSMSDPPLQQFPGPARGIILADEGDEMTSIDWSQIEPVIMANIAGESTVLAGYEDGTSDVYTDVSIKAGGIDRKTAKVVLLAQLYGEGIAKLAADLGIPQDEARELKAAIFGALPRIKGLAQKLRNIGQDHRKVFTLSGRILPIPMGMWQGEMSVATHKAVNATVQGSAYDVLAETLIGIDEAGLGDAVYCGMHDEIVCSTSAAHDIRKIMETPPARLCELAGRVPVLRTDMLHMGERWITE